MVRRRSASPKASSPVRSTSPNHNYTPAAPMKSSAPPPPRAPASSGGGFMSQMAATAGGVAIGSAVGHAVSNMFSGSREDSPASVQLEQLPQQQQQKQYSSPCEFEWRQFLECAQNQSDVGICQSFNDIFKQCQTRYGGQ